MTREEAIQELLLTEGLIQQNGQDYLDDRDIPLLDMAIEALSAEQKTGKWIKPIQHDHLLQCSECEYEVTIGMAFEYDYCPLCGARMRGENE